MFPSSIAKAIRIGFSILYPMIGLGVYADAKSNWYPVGGEISSVEYTSVAYGNGHFVAVGNGGRYSVSSNGVDWTSHVIDLPELYRLFRITRVVPTESGWYAVFQVNRSGSVLYTKDPTNWPTPFTSSWPYFVDAARKVGTQVLLQSTRNSVIRILGNSFVGTTVKLGAKYYSIATDGDRYVLCGEEGKILSSTDGIDWTSQISGTSERLNRIKYTGSEFICVGQNGVLLRSTHGDLWETVHSGGPDYIDVAAFKGDYYIVSSYEGPVLRCDPSGKVEDLELLSKTVFGIAASESQLVICGPWGLLAHSPDGERWFNLDGRNGGDLYGFAFVDGKGVLARHPSFFRGLEFSKDLQVWHQSVSAEEYSIPFSHDDQFYRYNTVDSQFYKSSDGLSWTLASDIPSLAENPAAIVSINGVIFAFSSSTLTAVFDESQEWKIPEEVVRGDPISLKYEQGKYLLTTNNSEPDLESEDGLTWSIRLLPNSDEYYANTWIEFKGAYYSPTGGAIRRSEDGVDWPEIAVDFFLEFPNADQRLFIFNEILYVVNDDGTIFWSEDGINWEGERLVKEGVRGIYSMLEFNGKLLAISGDGQMYAQTPHPIPTANLEMVSNSKQKYDYTATLSDTHRLVVAQESSADLLNWDVSFLSPKEPSNIVAGEFDLALGETETRRFHRASVIDRNNFRGTWAGVLETNLLTDGECQVETSDDRRMIYQLDWFPDNRITLDLFRNDGYPIEAQLEGSIDPISMKMNLVHHLNTSCIDLVDCEVSLGVANGVGLSLVIQWTEPVCGENNCNFQRTLRLYR